MASSTSQQKHWQGRIKQWDNKQAENIRGAANDLTKQNIVNILGIFGYRLKFFLPRSLTIFNLCYTLYLNDHRPVHCFFWSRIEMGREENSRGTWDPGSHEIT